MKRIAIVLLGDFTKDARSINMSKSFLDSGHDISIINTSRDQKSYTETIYNISVPKSGIIKYFKFYLKTRKLLKIIQPDIIIAGDLFSLPASCNFYKAKVIYDSREIYSHLAALRNSYLKQLFWKFIELKYIYKVHHTIVTANSDLDFLKKIYGNINITVIKNYPSKMLKPSSNKKIQKIKGISNDHKIFLYQGVVQEGRGIKNMINLLQFFDNTNAVIIGDGDYKRELIDFTYNNKLEERVFFIESVPYKQLLDYTCHADIGFSLIKPLTKSYINALPNKIFEYALSNVPTLASDLPEMKKIISKYKIGICVSPYNIDKQIHSINEILNNNYDNIDNIALKEFIWENQNKKLLKLIN